jgi:hypothetical protein
LADGEITREGRERLRGSVAPGSLLCLWLDELTEALCRAARDEDAGLIQRLRDTWIDRHFARELEKIAKFSISTHPCDYAKRVCSQM